MKNENETHVAESGRIHEYLIEKNSAIENNIEVWCDDCDGSAIRSVQGVCICIRLCGKFVVSIDKRYDVDIVIKNIEASIKS